MRYYLTQSALIAIIIALYFSGFRLMDFVNETWTLTNVLIKVSIFILLVAGYEVQKLHHKMQEFHNTNN